MKHLDYSPTPITPLPYYSRIFNAKLIAKRDDLFSEGGGGSKARMLQYILADVKNQYDILVTAGGPFSNFNRACALMCARLEIPMHLVEYTDFPDEFNMSLNYYLCKLSEIKTTRCKRNEVSDTIDSILANYKAKGIKAKFIYAGGKCLEGFYAYYDAVKELRSQCDNIDYVFMPCSTGTTLTGVCAGLQDFFPTTKVFAISTARTEEIEKQVLNEDMKILNTYLKSSFGFDNMYFFDDYLCGGYAKFNNELFSTIKECISREGMIIDPTYSGKAFWGMKKILGASDEFVGKNILFWNTGGIFNLLSTVLIDKINK